MLEKGIAHFFPLFQFKKVKVNKIFAGGFHSYALIDFDSILR